MIIRREQKQRYSVISNEALEDVRLSWKARGILCYLLSKPDSWSVQSDHLTTQSDKDGRDAVRTALKELETFGYLRRTRHKRPDGTWEWESVVSEAPSTERTEKGKPVVGGFSANAPVAEGETAGQTMDGFSIAGNPGHLVTTEGTSTEEVLSSTAAPSEDEPPSATEVRDILLTELEDQLEEGSTPCDVYIRILDMADELATELPSVSKNLRGYLRNEVIAKVVTDAFPETDPKAFGRLFGAAKNLGPNGHKFIAVATAWAVSENITGDHINYIIKVARNKHKAAVTEGVLTA